MSKPIFAELMTNTGPIYVNADHVIFVRRKPTDPNQSLLEMTNPVPDEVGYITVNHDPVDVVLRLSKGME